MFSSIQRLAPILGSVPLRCHRIPGDKGTRKGTTAPNSGQFTLIFGAEALSAWSVRWVINNSGQIFADFRRHCAKYNTTIPMIKRKERKYIFLVKVLVAQSRTRVTYAPRNSLGTGYLLKDLIPQNANIRRDFVPSAVRTHTFTILVQCKEVPINGAHTRTYL